MPVDTPPPPDPSRTGALHRFPATVRHGGPTPPVIVAGSAAIAPRAAALPLFPTPLAPSVAAAAIAPGSPAPTDPAASLTPTAAADLVARRLAGRGVTPAAVHDACRLAAALVAHVRHSGGAGAVSLAVTLDGDEVTLTVDAEHRMADRPDLSGIERQVRSGSGDTDLAVVDHLASRWGRARLPHGSRAWAVLAAPRTTSPAPAVRPSVAPAELLVHLAAVLAEARTTAEVAEATADVVRHGLGALGVRFSVVERSRHHLVSLAQAWPGGLDTAARRDPLDDTHASPRVARSGRPLYLTGRVEVERALPALAADPTAVTVEAVAAVPLQVDGVTTGVVAVVWDHPRDLDHDERGVLTAIASFAAAALHRATLAEEHRATADVLQATLLPQQLPDLPGIDVETVYRPIGCAPEVGGDWYDAFVLPSGNLYLVIGDVAGHGTTAARTMGKIRYSARAYAVAGAGPAEVLARTNALLRHHGRDLLASMLCVEYDPQTRTAVVADAGHMPAVVVPRRGPARFVDAPVGPMLGATDDVTYDASTHALAPGETVLLYTDGLVERRSVAIDDCLADLATAAGQMRRFGATTARLARGLADRRAASDVVTDDVCVLAVTHH